MAVKGGSGESAERSMMRSWKRKRGVGCVDVGLGYVGQKGRG